jgi:hypothetical protein
MFMLAVAANPKTPAISRFDLARHLTASTPLAIANGSDKGIARGRSVPPLLVIDA